MAVKHVLVSAVADAGIAGEIEPSHWNAAHKGAYEVVNANSDFGAVGDGVTDDTTAIQNSIDALGTTGGMVILPNPSVAYAISAEITIGDGTSTTQSTKNHIALVGVSGGGYNLTTNVKGVALTWIGATDATKAMIRVKGPITGVRIENIGLDCQNKAGIGLSVTHSQKSVYKKFDVVNFTTTGYEQTSYPATVSVSWGCNQNRFEQIFGFSTNTNANAIGFLVGAATVGGGILDCAQNVYDGVYLTCQGASSVGIKLRFTDFCQWRNVLTSANTGLLLQETTDNVIWPSGIEFYGTALIGNVVKSATWAGSGIGLYGYSTGDGEVIPNIVGIFGITNTGQLFGVTTVATTTVQASIRLPHGTAPTAPVNGDMWTTTAGLYVRINGSTIGPLS